VKRALILSIISVAIVLLAQCTAEKGEALESLPCDTATITYTNAIESIISVNCTTAPGCHQQGSSEGDLTTYEGVMLKVNSGSFKHAVITEKTMPPTGPLPLETRMKIQCWLRDGAPKN